MIWLLEADTHDGSGEVTLRYATAWFVTKPGDVPANVVYEPRIKVPANYERRVFGDGRTGGRSQTNGGEAVLLNHDGGLNDLIGHAFDGRELRLLRVEPGAALATATLVLRGRQRPPAFGYNEVALRLRDRQDDFERPLQPARFAGTNLGAAGIEGTADDIKDQIKPRLWGVTEEVSPILLNSAALIFGLNFDAAGNPAPIASLDALYVLGVAAGTFDGDDADLATLQAASIPLGRYRTSLALGLVRLGFSPAGPLTADVTQGATAADRTVAAIVRDIAEGVGDVDPSDIDDDTFDALDAANDAVIGLYASDEMTIAEALDRVCGSVGAWWTFDRLGRLTVGRIEAPAGIPAAEIGPAEILDEEAITITNASDAGGSVPAWRINVNYRRAWTVQNGTLAGSIGDARRAFLARAWRTVKAEDDSVLTRFAKAPELTFDTLLTAEADAQAEATRLLALHGTARHFYRVQMKSDVADSIELGDAVRLTAGRYGLDGGKLGLVLGLVEDAAANLVILEIWA